MAKKLDPMDLKQIITLRLDGLSNRIIAKTLGMSRNTINQYISLFESCDIELRELLELSEASLQELFPVKTTIQNERFDALMKYFEKVNLARNYPGFTFLYHHKEYESSVENPYSYTQFMEHYNRSHRKIEGSMKLNHLAGNEMMIDFAGKHLHVTDKQTGEIKPVEVFVAILPCSQHTFVEASWSQKREDLMPCIVSALNFYGGVPNAIVSDNLKSAVSRASKYEPQINKALKDLARHYNCAVNPTRAYAPQDKALVEHAVNLVYQRIYYPLRDMTFFSLAELNKEIRKRLASYNNQLFQLKEASRKELFQSIERSTLKPLPATAYELKDYRRAKVQKIGYVFVSLDKNYYSVPYRFIGMDTQVATSRSWVEVYHKGERIAKHTRIQSKGAYTTEKDHLSSSHKTYSQWSPDFFKSLAKKHGEYVLLFIEALLAPQQYPETAYKRAMGVIQLHKIYGSDRLNNACQRALYGEALSYHRVKNILKNNMDHEQLNTHELTQTKSHIPQHENIRGANSYN